MKEETYEKALKKHYDKISGYADKLHDITFDMLADGCSANDVIGMLENMKMYIFYKTVNATNTDILGEILEMMKEE